VELTPLETHNDLPSFVPEKDLRTALSAAQNVARQRDELASENARLRREVEAAARARREVEEGTLGAEGVTKRLRLLREALVRKDQEILNLKSYQLGHAKQLKDAHEAADRLRRERAELEGRLRSRDGAFGAIERERENLSRALDGARRDGERAAQVVMQADSAVGEWRVALDGANRELDEARRQIVELRTAWQSLAADRQRLVESHALEMTTVRADAAAAQERTRREAERALADATARYDSAREAHAIALRAADDEHASELAEERDARRAVEAELASTRERLALVEASRNWADSELAAARARLDLAEGGLDGLTRHLYEAHAREIEGLTRAHQVESENLVAAFEAEHHARVVQLEADLAEASRDRDEARARAEALQTDRDGQFTAHTREVAERHGEVLRESEARFATALDAAQRYFEEALGAQRESLESEIASLRATLSGDEAQVLELEASLTAAREALGEYVTASAERVAAAEREAREASDARERYARKLTAAAQRIRELEVRTTDEPSELAEQVGALTHIVGEVMSAAVVQLSGAAAARAGRRAPEMTDVEEAISVVGDGLPDHVGDLLWRTRDTFFERARAHCPS
jgi:chromosome segregation ATPase